jgi:hypothetical protein
MANLQDKEKLLERPTTRPPEVKPPKAKPIKPAPPRLFRWIEWLAALVAAAALVAGGIWLAGQGGDEEVVAFHPEHGPFTDMAARDLSAVDLDSRLAGLDANFDRDVIAFPEFTPFPDSYAPGVAPSVQRLAGLDANLDPDVAFDLPAAAVTGAAVFEIGGFAIAEPWGQPDAALLVEVLDPVGARFRAMEPVGEPDAALLAEVLDPVGARFRAMEPTWMPNYALLYSIIGSPYAEQAVGPR